MLKKFHDDPEHQRDTASDEADERLYVIDMIIDRREGPGRRGREYLVKWKGYDEDENTWEPAGVIEADVPGAVEDFRKVLQESGEDIWMDLNEEEEA